MIGVWVLLARRRLRRGRDVRRADQQRPLPARHRQPGGQGPARRSGSRRSRTAPTRSSSTSRRASSPTRRTSRRSTTSVKAIKQQRRTSTASPTRSAAPARPPACCRRTSRRRSRRCCWTSAPATSTEEIAQDVFDATEAGAGGRHHRRRPPASIGTTLSDEPIRDQRDRRHPRRDDHPEPGARQPGGDGHADHHGRRRARGRAVGWSGCSATSSRSRPAARPWPR